MLTRLVVLLAFVQVAAAAAAEFTDADIVALDGVALRDELAAGRLSAERVTDVFLRRIAAVDDSGPQLGAVIELNPDARAVARELDRRRGSGVVGPLHGVPVLIKANIDTADRMATTAGSLALAEHRAASDAALVTRLRAAGAVLLGKTNLSEWANFRSLESTSGWSSLGGQTKNAYVLDRNPCGSSSGAAVAVAARLAPLAVGTETDGSIVCPAAANGVVGIKPTLGAIDTAGIIPLARSQDTAGPMARTVAAAALLLDVLEGRPEAPSRRASLRGIRIGVVRNYDGAGRDSGAEMALAATLNLLAANGIEFVDPVFVSLPQTTRGAEHSVLLAEFRDGIDAYLSRVDKGPRSLLDLIAFNDRHAAEVMPHFEQDLLLAASKAPGVGTPLYVAAKTLIAAERERLLALFETQRLTALVAPANSRAWRTNYARGDRFTVGSSSIAAVAGLPAIALPIMLDRELPVGVNLIGRPGDEHTLLAVAAALEARRGSFPEPRFLSEAALD
jgi:amidase